MILQHSILYYSILQYSILYYIILQGLRARRGGGGTRKGGRYGWKPYIYIYIYIYMCDLFVYVYISLIELEFMNSSCSNSNLSARVVRAYPLIGTRQTVPCRAIRGDVERFEAAVSQSAVPSPPLRYFTALHLAVELGRDFIWGFYYMLINYNFSLKRKT